MAAKTSDAGGERALTLGWLLDSSERFLRKKGAQDARLAAEYLAARILKRKRLELPLLFGSVMPERFVEALRRGVMRVASGEPVQYVLGQWAFRGISVKVDRRALIPRPETEELVGLLLNSERVKGSDSPVILDYGTGTGCIALAVASELPGARVVAADISADALALAAENAAMLGLSDRVTFVNTSLVDLADVFDPGVFDAVVSNPPYIPTAAYETLDRSVKDYEPREALDGGADGLDTAREIADESAMLLSSGGGLFMELSAEDDHTAKMSEYLRELGFEEIRCVRDVYGAERFVCAVLGGGI